MENMAGVSELQELLWTFIQALRARVMDAQHAGIVLGQHGRLDRFFDAALPSLVDVLQREGLYNKDSEMVTHVTSQALQEVSVLWFSVALSKNMNADFELSVSLSHAQSFGYHLESTFTKEPSKTIELAKLLSRAFFVHKAHFKIQRSLAASAISEFHQDEISWCLTKMTGFLKQESASKVKKLKDRFRAKAAAALTYLKVLVVLLPGVEGRDALRM